MERVLYHVGKQYIQTYEGLARDIMASDLKDALTWDNDYQRLKWIVWPAPNMLRKRIGRTVFRINLQLGSSDINKVHMRASQENRFRDLLETRDPQTIKASLDPMYEKVEAGLETMMGNIMYKVANHDVMMQNHMD